MAIVGVSTADFSAGELSPRLWGRYDLSVYFNSVRRMENFIADSVGLAKFRNGTVYAAEAAGNQKAFLWTFRFSSALSFVLEFTDQKVRFYRNNGRVTEDAQNITAVTQANPAVVTYSGADNYSNGDSVFITGIVGMDELNGREFTVANVNTAANTFELASENSTGYDAYVSGGSVEVITEVATPFLEAELFDLKFAQKGVDLYIVHPNHNPRKLTYTSPTSWAMTLHSPTALTLTANNRPSAVTFYENRLVYGGTTNNPQTLYFSKAGDEDDFTTGTAADSGIEYTISGDGNTIRWLKGTNRFLAIGTFSDVLEGTGGIDNVITPSSISIRPSNSYGVADINPQTQGNQIFYIQENDLVVRSYEYDFQADTYVAVNRNTISDHITKTGISQIAFQSDKSNFMWCIRTDGDLIGLSIDEQESISGWHRHNTDGEFVSIASTPRVTNYDQLWACVKRTVNGNTKYYIEYFEDTPIYSRREDYVSSTKAADSVTWENLVYEEQKQYIHVDASATYDGSLAGSAASATVTPGATTGTGVTFTASASVFSSGDVGREIWRKSVTGAETGRAEITGYTSATQVTVTVLEDFDSTSAIPAGEWYLTSATITGLDHLEGKTVSVVADGGQHPTRTVSSGSITLDAQASVVHVGLSYTGFIQTNDFEVPQSGGGAQTRKKSIHQVGIKFLDSLYAEYGTDYYNLNQIEFRVASMRMDRPPTLYTGEVKETYANQNSDDIEAGWSRGKTVVIKQSQPFPCNIQLLTAYASVS